MSKAWDSESWNKNRPSSSSSKYRVDTFRVAPGLQASAKKASRDPRFSQDGTAIDQAGWIKANDYILQLQKQEVEQMTQALADSKKAKGAKARKKRKKQLAADDEDELKLEL